MPDVSCYTIEYRVIAATWYHLSDISNSAMRDVKNRLRDKFGSEPPKGKHIINWENKLFTNGDVMDRSRMGQPNERGDIIGDVEESVVISPTQSSRLRSNDLAIPRTTLRRVLKLDLGLKPWKSVKVQFLSSLDYENRVEGRTTLCLVMSVPYTPEVKT
jgi:hypothetical protein